MMARPAYLVTVCHYTTWVYEEVATVETLVKLVVALVLIVPACYDIGDTVAFETLYKVVAHSFTLFFIG